MEQQIQLLAIDLANQENKESYCFNSISKQIFDSKVSSISDINTVHQFLYSYLNTKKSISTPDYWVIKAIFDYKFYDLIEVLFQIPYPKSIPSQFIYFLDNNFDNIDKFIKVATQVYDYSKLSNDEQWNILVTLNYRKGRIPNSLKILLKSGLSPNVTDQFGKPFWYLNYQERGELLTEYGADLFIKVQSERWEPTYAPSKYPNIIPLLHYMFIVTDPKRLSEEVIPQLEGLDLNVLDDFGRNILHVYLTENKDNYLRNTIYYQLVELDVDSEQKAIIDDQRKVITAKMNKTLPEGYGYSPRELYQLYEDLVY